MATERVADMTVEELKTLIAEVVAQQLSQGMRSHEASALTAPILPPRTQAEQHKINQNIIEWLRKWREEGDEDEQRETLEYLQKALDEDRLSNRPLFPKQ